MIKLEKTRSVLKPNQITDFIYEIPLCDEMSLFRSQRVYRLHVHKLTTEPRLRRTTLNTLFV